MERCGPEFRAIGRRGDDFAESAIDRPYKPWFLRRRQDQLPNEGIVESPQQWVCAAPNIRGRKPSSMREKVTESTVAALQPLEELQQRGDSARSRWRCTHDEVMASACWLGTISESALNCGFIVSHDLRRSEIRQRHRFGRLGRARLSGNEIRELRHSLAAARSAMISAMLLLKPGCECCDGDLPPDSTRAWICSFECTFCSDCVATRLNGACPNCAGELVRRPVRSSAALQQYPATRERTFKPRGCGSG